MSEVGLNQKINMLLIIYQRGSTHSSSEGKSLKEVSVTEGRLKVYYTTNQSASVKCEQSVSVWLITVKEAAKMCFFYPLTNM